MVARRKVQLITTGLLLARAALIIALPVLAIRLWPTVPDPSLGAPSDAPAIAPSTGHVQTNHDLAWYAPLWERDLKQPPIPPTTAPSAQPEVADGPVPTLLATCVEQNARYAHLRFTDGRVRMTRVGDSVGRFRIAAIEQGRVRLIDGESGLWIEIPRVARR